MCVCQSTKRDMVRNRGKLKQARNGAGLSSTLSVVKWVDKGTRLLSSPWQQGLGGGRRQSGRHCFVGTVHFSPYRPRTPLRKDTISSRMKSSCHTGVHCSFHTEKKDLFVNSFKQIDQCQGLNYHLKLIIKPSHPESSPDEVAWYQDIYMLHVW